MNNLLWSLQLGVRSHAGSQSLTCLSRISTVSNREAH